MAASKATLPLPPACATAAQLAVLVAVAELGVGVDRGGCFFFSPDEKDDANPVVSASSDASSPLDFGNTALVEAQRNSKSNGGSMVELLAPQMVSLFRQIFRKPSSIGGFLLPVLLLLGESFSVDVMDEVSKRRSA